MTGISPSSRDRGTRPPISGERGSIVLLTALSMVVLLGMVALAVDGSYLYTELNRMSAAADAAAKSAALERRLSAGAKIGRAHV